MLSAIRQEHIPETLRHFRRRSRKSESNRSSNWIGAREPALHGPDITILPQAPQAPVKDFATFNPAIMLHNGLNGELPYPELIYILPNGNTEQSPNEKVFKRMNYQKDLFKDDYQTWLTDTGMYCSENGIK